MDTFTDMVLAEFELGPDDRQLVGEIERTLAELDRISAALSEAPVMVAGSTGQQRVNPLFAEARAHREILAKLIKALALPGDESAPTLAQQLATAKARDAANARWGNANARPA